MHLLSVQLYAWLVLCDSIFVVLNYELHELSLTHRHVDVADVFSVACVGTPIILDSRSPVTLGSEVVCIPTMSNDHE